MICKSIQLLHNIFNLLNWLPDPIPSIVDKDYYGKFQIAYQSETIEQYCLKLISTITSSKWMQSSILVNICVHKFIQYFQCGKTRYLYSEHALSAEDKIVCQIIIDK
ncbi:10509_t:CDS:2 [Funneliformis mosseae]|uniref:10509_t:CDS:1 n=1 Tax=Funneliformis mosseae TaxID=27381 RepID=A0A9N9A985_FUNMO|nr:10509_t:CDS:2 [Funneliformis mosseae]